MKPSQPNVEYCIKHREFVNGLLEKKGGWQEGDRCAGRLGGSPPLVARVNNGKAYHVSTEGSCKGTFWSTGNWGDAWLPSVDDVLAMLTEAMDGRRDWMLEHIHNLDGTPRDYLAMLYPKGNKPMIGIGSTPLIALLELLRVVSDA